MELVPKQKKIGRTIKEMVIKTNEQTHVHDPQAQSAGMTIIHGTYTFSMEFMFTAKAYLGFRFALHPMLRLIVA